MVMYLLICIHNTSMKTCKVYHHHLSICIVWCLIPISIELKQCTLVILVFPLFLQKTSFSISSKTKQAWVTILFHKCMQAYSEPSSCLNTSDGSGPKPGPGPARSPGFLESPGLDIGRRAQAWARPRPVVKSLGAQRALGIWLSFKKLALFWKSLSKNLKSQMQIILFATFSLSLVPLFIFQVFWSYA